MLSTPPVSPPIVTAVALRLIGENIESAVSVTALSASDYWAVLEKLSVMGFSGGIAYDAFILRTAVKTRAERILTFTVRDFRRLANGKGIEVTAP